MTLTIFQLGAAIGLQGAKSSENQSALAKCQDFADTESAKIPLFSLRELVYNEG